MLFWMKFIILNKSNNAVVEMWGFTTAYCIVELEGVILVEFPPAQQFITDLYYKEFSATSVRSQRTMQTSVWLLSTSGNK